MFSRKIKFIKIKKNDKITKKTFVSIIFFFFRLLNFSNSKFFFALILNGDVKIILKFFKNQTKNKKCINWNINHQNLGKNDTSREIIIFFKKIGSDIS